MCQNVKIQTPSYVHLAIAPKLERKTFNVKRVLQALNTAYAHTTTSQNARAGRWKICLNRFQHSNGDRKHSSTDSGAKLLVTSAASED